MAKVLNFPVKQLPKEIEERLYEITATYVNSMNEVVDEVCGDPENNEKYAEMIDLMLGVVLEGLMDAVGKIGES